MYAPHADPARMRPAVFEFVDPGAAAGDSVGPLIPTVGVIGAVVAICVAYGLLRRHALVALPTLLPRRKGSTAARTERGARTNGSPRADARYRKGAIWLGAAVGLTGLVGLAPLAGALLGVRPATLSTVVVTSAMAVDAALLPAVLALVPSPIGWAGRLREALDVVIVCLCLLFCVWAVTERHAGVTMLAYLVLALHCWLLATAGVVGLHAGAGRRGVGLCAAGVWVTTLAVTGLALQLAYQPAAGWLLPLLAALVSGPLMLWRGSRLLTTRHCAPTNLSLPRAASVTVALALALFAGLHQLLEGQRVDWGAATIGGAAMAGLVMRRLIPRALPVGGPPAHTDPTPVMVEAPTGDMPVAGAVELVAPETPQASPWRALLARTDPLTGLASRLQLSLAIAGRRCEPRPAGTLLAIEVDGGGGAVRDQLLGEITRRLTAAVAESFGDGDLAARSSETGFAVLTGASALQAYGLAGRLHAALARPVTVGGETVQPSVRVGLAPIVGAPSTEDVLRRAELAVRRARQSGQVEWYDIVAEQAMQRQATIERDLPGALRRGELDLSYQPIMDLVLDRPMAVEALLRWHHPQLGSLLPADVIPVAEGIGVIDELGHWVLHKASAQLSSWRREGHDLSMSINISARHDSRSFSQELARLLAAHDLPPDRLVFEVAESGIHDGDCLAEQLGALRALGVRTAIDEFGAGPESLSHLREVPIDMVKIGQSFFGAHDAAAWPGAATVPLVDLIVDVGRRLGIDVAAQRLEAPEQLAVVRAAGCRIGQGHLFARPQPAEHTEAYLAGFGRWKG